MTCGSILSNALPGQRRLRLASQIQRTERQARGTSADMAGLITIQTAAQAPKPSGDTGTLGMAYNLANGGVGTSHGLRLVP